MGRCCYSKSVALVFLWILCVSAALWHFNEGKEIMFSGLKFYDYVSAIILESIAPVIMLVIFVPLSGFLADQKYGNFKIFKAGCVLMFVGSVLFCLEVLILKNIDTNKALIIICTVVALLACLVFFGGSGACLVTVFQLGLDQMPDASSTDVIAYISWWYICTAFGFWSSNLLYSLIKRCSSQEFFLQVWSLYPSLCTSIILCTLLVFGRKWLIIEPKSHQSLKNIYRVLKFAAKHKAPLNRSAFTYWEARIPSRMDLGKSRYGGPFTFEQVEDVKTLFRLLITFLPVLVNVFSSTVHGTLNLLTNTVLKFPSNSSCISTVISKFTYSPLWSCMVMLLVYKFIIYQKFKHMLGSSLTRICVITLLALVFNINFCTLSMIPLVQSNIPASQWVVISYSVLSYTVLAMFIIFTTEFVCAQSPYSMRGLLSAFVFFVIIFSGLLGKLLNLVLTNHCDTKHCKIIRYSLGGGFGVVGFLLQIIVAWWYKWRVRGEEYELYRQVEETYSRYLRVDGPS